MRRTVFLLLASILLVSCGGGRQPHLGNFGLASPATEKTVVSREIHRDQVLAELGALPTPQGVGDSLFEELKAALQEALLAKGASKIVAKPPRKAVNDLEIVDLGGAHYVLTWSYFNPGDYNQDGIVNVMDITPLAAHFNESVDENNKWIDGSGDGAITIIDITPLAFGFLNEVAGYSIQGADNPEGEFAEIGRVVFSAASGEGQKSFRADLPESEHLYFAVAPFDSAGELGRISNVVALPNQLPVAHLAAEPTEGNVLLEVSFDANESYDPDGTIVRYDYDWDGDDTYDLINGGVAPFHIYSDVGEYDATVRVTDDNGAQDTDSVRITVNKEAPVPPLPPLNPDATDGEFTDKIQVSWDPPATGPVPDGYNIYRSNAEDGSYALVGSSPSSLYDDTTVPDLNTYWYKVSAYNMAGEGEQAGPESGYKSHRGDWWMFGHDPQHTRRSPFVGSQTATLKWRYETGSQIYSSPAIDADGTIYVGSYDECLHAINPDGSVKWLYETGGPIYSSPAIGSDGTIYVGSGDNYFYAINSDGSLKWRFGTGDQVSSSPAIGDNGTIYVGSNDHTLYAIRPNMALKWYYETEFWVPASPSVGADGTVYVGSGDGYLYAIDPANGKSVWKYATGSQVRSSPSVGADGTIYVGSNDNCLYAINPNGTLKWRYETEPGWWIWSSPAIGSDGTIYVGSNDSCLYAINPNGTLKWRYETGNWIRSSPAIDADGTIYVGNNGNCLYAINPDGTLKWEYKTGGPVFSSPAVGSDGTIYVGSGDGYLYAISGS